MLRAAAAIAVTPVAALLALAGLGLAARPATLIAIAVVLLAAIVLAALWSRDLALLVETVQRAGAESGLAARTPLLRPAARLLAEIERLSRTMASRAALLVFLACHITNKPRRQNKPVTHCR